MAHPDPMELNLFADGELGRRRARKVAVHLDACPECSGAVERIRATGDMLRLATDEVLAESPLAGFADRVMERIAVPAEEPLSWRERARAWFAEFFKYRKRVWAPSLALATSAAAALVLVFGLRPEPGPAVELPAGTTVLSVSFGSSVDGTVFEIEDKDGSTTAVIWVDEAKVLSGENVKAYRDLDSEHEVAAVQSSKSSKTNDRIASSRPSTGKKLGGSGAKYA